MYIKNVFTLLFWSLFALVILPVFSATLMCMEKEQPTVFTFVSTDNVQHTLSPASIALSKTLNELIQETYFDSTKPIPLEVDDKVASLLVSCLQKISAIDFTENQAVESALDPLYMKNSCFSGNNFFLHVCLLLKESNRLNISMLLNYLINFISDYLHSCKDINEISKSIKHIEELPLEADIKRLIKERLTGKGNNKRLGDKLISSITLVFKDHTSSVRSVAFSPCGKYALTGSYDYTARIWDVSTGQTIKKLIGHINVVFSVAFSPCGKYALTGSSDKTARLWDVSTGQTIKELIGHTDCVFSVAFSPCGKYALTGSWDNTARLWDVSTGQTIKDLIGHTNCVYVYSVAFSPCGKYALTGSSDMKARLLVLVKLLKS